MSFKKKLTGLIVAALCLLPVFGQAYTINGNLDVRGFVVGGTRGLGTNNLTIGLSGGILKIQCGNSDCSTSNPGWITLPNTNPGQFYTYKITSSPQFGDATAGDSDFTGTGTCSWGTTAGVDWGNNMPLLLGAFHDGSTVVFGLARGPVLTTGASSNIGYQDNCPSSASQNNVLAMTSTNVTSSHANKAFFPIGAVRATKNSSDNYTFTTLDDGDGIGIFYNFGSRYFDMPTGQMGSDSGKYTTVASGTGPTYTANNQSKYIPFMNGMVYHIFDHNNSSGGTAGAGANPVDIATAYTALNYTGLTTRNLGVCFNSGSISTLANAFVSDNTSRIRLEYQSTIVSGRTFCTGAGQNNASRNLTGNVWYKAF